MRQTYLTTIGGSPKPEICFLLGRLRWTLLPKKRFGDSLSGTPNLPSERRTLTTRGVTRLDGARGKKQVWRPHVRTWPLSKGNLLLWRKYLWHFFGVSASLQWFAAPIVIRRQGNCVPLVTPLLTTELIAGLICNWRTPRSKTLACSISKETFIT